jgi:hypothetical protein
MYFLRALRYGLDDDYDTGYCRDPPSHPEADVETFPQLLDAVQLAETVKKSYMRCLELSFRILD